MSTRKIVPSGAGTTPCHCHYDPIYFSSLSMSSMKGMGEFVFNLNHISLKSSPSASSIDQNMCNNFIKYTSLGPHVQYTRSILSCITLDCQYMHQLNIQQKTKTKTTFFRYTIKALYHSTTIRVCCMSKKKVSLTIKALGINMY